VGVPTPGGTDQPPPYSYQWLTYFRGLCVIELQRYRRFMGWD